MARLLFTNRFEALARRLTWVRNFLWRFESWLVSGLAFLLGQLGATRAARISAALMARLGPVSPKHKLVLDNVDIAFADQDEATRARIAKDSWRSVGVLFAEMAQMPKLAANPSADQLHIVSQCDLEPYRNRQRAGIFCGAHIANWELLLLVLSLERIPALAFVAPLQNPHLGRMLSRIRTSAGCETYNRDASLRPMIRHLRTGGSIGTLIDVRVDGGLEVPFFGHPMRISNIPARLALKYGCDLIPYQCERLENAAWRVTIHHPISKEGLEGDEQAQFRDFSARHLELVEGWIRAAPASWLMTTRRWERALYPRAKKGHSTS